MSSKLFPVHQPYMPKSAIPSGLDAQMGSVLEQWERRRPEPDEKRGPYLFEQSKEFGAAWNPIADIDTDLLDGGLATINLAVHERAMAIAASLSADSGHTMDTFLDIARMEVMKWIILVGQTAEDDVELRNQILGMQEFRGVFPHLARLNRLETRYIYDEVLGTTTYVLGARVKILEEWAFNFEGGVPSFADEAYRDMWKARLAYGSGRRLSPPGCPMERIAHGFRKKTLATGFALDLVDLAIQKWTRPFEPHDYSAARNLVTH